MRGKLAIAALPPLSLAVKWIFQFSSARRVGKLATAALPPIPSAVKSIFQLSSTQRGGKLEIVFTPRVHVAKIFKSDFSSFFPFFRLLVGHGSGLSSTKWRMDMCESQLGQIISNHNKKNHKSNVFRITRSLHLTSKVSLPESLP